MIDSTKEVQRHAQVAKAVEHEGISARSSATSSACGCAATNLTRDGITLDEAVAVARILETGGDKERTDPLRVSGFSRSAPHGALAAKRRPGRTTRSATPSARPHDSARREWPEPMVEV